MSSPTTPGLARAPSLAAAWISLALCCLLQSSSVLLSKNASVATPGSFLHRATSPFFIASLCALAGQFFLWRRVLRTLPLPTAYPITAIVVPLNLLGGALLFRERLSLQEIAAASLITVGVAVVARAQATSGSSANGEA